MRPLRATLLTTMGLVLMATMAGRAGEGQAVPGGTAPAEATRVTRGEYLVRVMLCNDCHTPFAMGPRGPEPDMTRMLSGHPQDLQMPPAPKLAAPWGMAGSVTNTAWAGPWGVSFTANLTPDKETGLGEWTEEMFLAAIRTGRHQGKGRQILPPMPIPWFQMATDDDLKAILAYLRSIPPVRNKVPTPLEPAE
jgi:hypothetical protein